MATFEVPNSSHAQKYGKQKKKRKDEEENNSNSSNEDENKNKKKEEEEEDSDRFGPDKLPWPFTSEILPALI